MSLDLEDIVDFADEHKTGLIIGVCVLAIGANFALGGASQVQSQMAKQSADAAAKAAQERAERIFFDKKQGCIAQAVSRNTKINNFVVGDTIVDPMSIKPDNPDGTPIAAGHVCSNDGSLFRIENGIAIELIGNSRAIRIPVIDAGVSAENQKVLERNKQLYELYGEQK